MIRYIKAANHIFIVCILALFYLVLFAPYFLLKPLLTRHQTGWTPPRSSTSLHSPY